MDNFYAKKNRKKAVAMLMADHAAYVAEQKKIHERQAAYAAGIRAATPAQDLERDDLYRSEPWRF